MYFIKNVILDLDNTLYNYDVCNDYALETTFKFLIKEYNLNIDIYEIYNLYYKINSDLKKIIPNTASSHNRTIYFKNLLKELNISISEVIKIKEYYWNNFYSKMILFNDVLEFLEYISKNNINIYILTDFTLNEQLEKLKILRIKITNFIILSIFSLRMLKIVQ